MDTNLTAEELRVAVHRHLMACPGLTAFELARVMGLPHPRGGGGLRMRKLLAAMAADGEAEAVTVPRDGGDTRPVTRWEAR